MALESPLQDELFRHLGMLWRLSLGFEAVVVYEEASKWKFNVGYAKRDCPRKKPCHFCTTPVQLQEPQMIVLLKLNAWIEEFN